MKFHFSSKTPNLHRSTASSSAQPVPIIQQGQQNLVLTPKALNKDERPLVMGFFSL